MSRRFSTATGSHPLTSTLAEPRGAGEKPHVYWLVVRSYGCTESMNMSMISRIANIYPVIQSHGR